MDKLWNFTVVGELPGPGPWKVASYRGVPLYVSPNSPPYMASGGALVPVDIGGAEKELLKIEGKTLMSASVASLKPL